LRVGRGRDRANLDIAWLPDESPDDASSLPAPGVLGAEVVEEPEAARSTFTETAASSPVEATED
jgi:type I restriction enzyme M protein